ncbi:nucleotide-diphospho-sugar transferase [Dichotomopilus funicola]|uniref:Nucleotide-diphospho-sugar transferase n=1 Tax=Dichotomopilus funicola TaxID=1934379 RepID=A0AAN6UZ24_9PEZI|nr:nucleotide-diphospho-sugar transferase [Dichotomopilus funicola]
MDFPRRGGGKKLILTIFSLSLLVVLLIRQRHASQEFLFQGDLFESLQVIDDCPTNNGNINSTQLASQHGSNNNIPNTIHQVWKTKNVETYVTEFGPSHESWKGMFEPFGYTVKLWTDDDVLQLITTTYPWLLSTYLAYSYDIQRADLARLAIIHAEGGIYADLDVYPRNVTDTECVQRLGLQAVFAPTQTAHIGLSNHFFMAVQGSPFLLWALQEAKRRAVSPSMRVLLPYLRVLWTSGPLMVTGAARQYVWVNDAGTRLDVGVLDEEKYRRRVLGHATGRSWHGPDGVFLNLVADHPVKAVLVGVGALVVALGVVFHVRRRFHLRRRHQLALGK